MYCQHCGAQWKIKILPLPVEEAGDLEKQNHSTNQIRCSDEIDRGLPQS